MSNLTEEQRQRMEQNRKIALAKRAAKQQLTTAPTVAASVTTNSKPKSLGSSGTNNHAFSIGYSSHASGSQNRSSYSPGSNQPRGSFTQKGVKALSSVQKSPISFYGDPKKGNLMLVSKDRVVLEMEYHQPTIDAVKTVPGRVFDPTTKKWSFPIKEYKKLLDVIISLQPNVAITTLPNIVVDTFSNPSKYKPTSEVDLKPINLGLRNALMEFQKEGVRFAISRAGRVLIADEMGLGKTIQALAVADYYHTEWPLLIVCPSSMRYQWKEEILKHVPRVQSYNIFVMVNGKEPIDKCARIVITSYDLMTSQKDKLLQKNFGIIIADECHFMKNIKAARTKAGLEIVANCSRRIFLSGTPVLSRPQELHSQISGINPSLFPKFFAFGQRYCDATQNKFGWDFTGASNIPELNILLSEVLMIRRVKKDVLAELPPKRREMIIIEAAKKKLCENKDFSGEFRKIETLDLGRRDKLLECYAKTAESKRKGVLQYIMDIMETGEKFLVFAHHKLMLDAITDLLEKNKVSYIRIDGSVNTEIRQLMCETFQSDENYKVAVLSITAANSGITLTAARLVIFAELYWNPGILAQAEDRAHRIGQQDSVLVQYLVQHGSADDIIWPLVKQKLGLLNEAGLSTDNYDTASTRLLEDKTQKDVMDYFNSQQDDFLKEIPLEEEFKEDTLEDDEVSRKKQKMS